MIAVIDSFITQEKADEILSHLPLSPIRKTNSNHPNELGDWYREGIPVFLQSIISSLYLQGHFNEEPDAITVNEYLPGQSIEAHVDDITYGEKIAVITLVGTSDIEFIRDNEVRPILLKPLSLIYWNGEERWQWEHVIPPVNERRVSLVIRKQSC